MNILHVEDNALKHANICNQINQVLPASISWAKTYEDTPIVLITAFGMKKKNIYATVQYNESVDWENEIKNIVKGLKKSY